MIILLSALNYLSLNCCTWNSSFICACFDFEYSYFKSLQKGVMAAIKSKKEKQNSKADKRVGIKLQCLLHVGKRNSK